MMVRAFSLLATWLGLIVQLRVANAATSNYRNNRNNSTVAEFGGVIFLGGWWDIRPGVDGEDAPSRCEAAVTCRWCCAGTHHRGPSDWCDPMQWGVLGCRR